MISTIIANDLRSWRRSGVVVILALTMVALLIGAISLSWQRLETLERERSAAELMDRQIFDSQGERNPHAAAHFSRYAFKPVSELMAFDPGITDYSGLAIWMEAHYQNPAVFRRAEDLGGTSRFADLSPAWLLQYIAPLFVILIFFSAIAGERELGTLRQMVATGVRPRTIVVAKIASVCIAVGAIVLLGLVLSLVISSSATSEVLADRTVRAAALVASYVIYLASIGAIVVGISALCRERRTALTVLLGLWAISFYLLPRLASAAAIMLFPAPSAAEISAEIDAAAVAAREDSEFQAQIEQDALDRYGVATREELPINYLGYSLQASEEYGEAIFEKIYGRLGTTFRNQERLVAASSLLSPALAMGDLSAGLAGTDRIHHDAFAQDAELHRRKIMRLLNDDFMLNAEAGQVAYTNDATLWRQVPDFQHTPPTLSELAPHYLQSVLVLLLYALGSLLFALFAVRRVQSGLAA